MAKYQQLVEDCKQRGWRTWCMAIEVGCRGFAGQSMWRALKTLGVEGAERKKLITEVCREAEVASQWIWRKRDEVWKSANAETAKEGGLHLMMELDQHSFDVYKVINFWKPSDHQESLVDDCEENSGNLERQEAARRDCDDSLPVTQGEDEHEEQPTEVEQLDEAEEIERIEPTVHREDGIETTVRKEDGIEPTTRTSEGNTDETMRKHNHLMSCLDLNTNGTLKYEKEGQYICIAQVFLDDRPFCIKDSRSQHSILGSNITIALVFYSKPAYSDLSVRKNGNELELGDDNINIKNISMDVYNVTVMVTGYEIIINITEFSKDDIGNYTFNIMNEFGFCNCSVQLLFEEDIDINRYPSGNVIEGQSVLLICQSISRRTTNNYSWTKNGITLSYSSSLVLENITQNDNGNYTCRMKNEESCFTKNELLIVNPLSCTTCVTEPHGLQLLKRFLGIGYFILPFVVLVVTVFCNISIHLYCKKLNKVTFETDENEISQEGIEMEEVDHGYHTINEDNFRIEDTGIENQSEIASSVRASNIEEAPLPVPASGSNEQQIEEEDDYLHPYCTVMQNTVEIHEYKGIVPGIVEHDGSDEVLNQELERLYEN
ncbi:unnamed protein product [Mytilus edulis]|uniref:Ig-like domain-containing protein n=1 Tax=Mytilus edulis TaxID=6550 RepID=A0A8S3QG91_MYTED|nr:unnamed protein product [Mytilus edulis]